MNGDQSNGGNGMGGEENEVRSEGFSPRDVRMVREVLRMSQSVLREGDGTDFVLRNRVMMLLEIIEQVVGEGRLVDLEELVSSYSLHRAFPDSVAIIAILARSGRQPEVVAQHGPMVAHAIPTPAGNTFEGLN